MAIQKVEFIFEIKSVVDSINAQSSQSLESFDDSKSFNSSLSALISVDNKAKDLELLLLKMKASDTAKKRLEFLKKEVETGKKKAVSILEAAITQADIILGLQGFRKSQKAFFAMYSVYSGFIGGKDLEIKNGEEAELSLLKNILNGMSKSKKRTLFLDLKPTAKKTPYDPEEVKAPAVPAVKAIVEKKAKAVVKA